MPFFKIGMSFMFSPLPVWVENVSRETFLQLEHYVSLLQKWNKAINLVGKSTEKEIWERHIADSLQLLPLIPSSIQTMADMGSGAGLPGMVIAIARPDIQVTLIERDQRKAAFLQEVSALLSLSNVTVANQDINHLVGTFSLITARALAPLSDLFLLAYPLLEKTNALCLFPKGQNFAKELEESQQHWVFDYQLIHSKTNENASIISVSELSKNLGSKHAI